MFNIPTLVTLTAPTGAGKSYLLEVMCNSGFNRIVSTTDRSKREGEIEGVHYYFISTEQSKDLENAGKFAEFVTYNGTRYGVTEQEMHNKMSDSKPPIVILEPSGVTQYRQYCAKNGYTTFNIFVDTSESIRLERLIERTSFEIDSLYKTGQNVQQSRVQKIISTNNSRLMAIIEKERNWYHTNRWDVLVSGTDTKKALEEITLGVKNRNSRSAIYQ